MHGELEVLESSIRDSLLKGDGNRGQLTLAMCSLTLV